MTDLTMSQFASKDDLLAAQAARIAELESQLEAIGAGGVEPLRKQAVAPHEEAIAEIVSASHDQAEFGERAINFLRDFQHLEYGTKLYPAPQAVQAAVPEAIEQMALVATQPAPAIFGDEDHVLVPRGLIRAACYAIDKKRDGTKTLAELRRYTTGDLSAATQPAAQGMDAGKLLAEKHTGMKVDYRGLLGQVQREIERSAPGHAEMLRQLQGHLQELGHRWYAGDTAVVDELLQLYCVERQARADLAAQAKQGGAA